MDKNGSLSVKQKRAIRALMSCPTVEKAAAAAQVGETTLYTWLRLPYFQTALNAAQDAAIDAISRRLVSQGDKFLDTIDAVLDAPDIHPATKLRAVEIGFTHMQRFVEMRMIVQRLAALEAKFDAQL